MNNKKKNSALFLAATLFTGTATSSASAQSVPFTSTIGQSSSCTIVVNRNGTMVPNPDSTVLSSKLAGGESGEALVTPQNGIYTVSANHYGVWRFAPEPLTAPNTSFQPSHSGTYNGANLYNERTTPVRLRAINNSIAYSMEIDLVATKDPGFSFPQGVYRSEVAVLCE